MYRGATLQHVVVPDSSSFRSIAAHDSRPPPTTRICKVTRMQAPNQGADDPDVNNILVQACWQDPFPQLVALDHRFGLATSY